MYNKGKFGTLLSQVPKRNLYALNKMAQEFVLRHLAKRLEGIEDLTDVALLINHHTYGDGKMFKNGWTDDDDTLAGNCSSITNPCHDVKPQCESYCRLIGSSSLVQEVMEEVLQLSVPWVNTPMPGVLEHSVLPGCNWKVDDEGTSKCWSRVLNDMGVCFTSFENGTCLCKM